MIADQTEQRIEDLLPEGSIARWRTQRRHDARGLGRDVRGGRRLQGGRVAFISPDVRMLVVLPPAGTFADASDQLDATLVDSLRSMLGRALVTSAAATAVVARVKSDPPPVTVTFDRPFMFLVYDEPTGQILFLGHLADPG
jgi:hypothetical protein